MPSLSEFITFVSESQKAKQKIVGGGGRSVLAEISSNSTDISVPLVQKTSSEAIEGR
jgi:hypothetical protein